MGNHQDGLPHRLVKAPQQRHHLPGVGRIEVAGRLVGEQQRRAGDQRPADAGPLLLSARELVGIGVELVRELEGFGQLFQLPRRGASAVEQQRQRDVLPHREQRHQIVELIDKTDLPAAEERALFLAQALKRNPLELDAAARGPVDPAQQMHQGGLAAARRAHDRDKFPPLQFKRDPAQRVDPGLPLAKAAPKVGYLQIGHLLFLLVRRTFSARLPQRYAVRLTAR